MIDYFKKLRNAKNSDELAKVVSDESEAQVRRRIEQMAKKDHERTIQRCDEAIQRYGLDFCIQIGEYAASKKACGK